MFSTSELITGIHVQTSSATTLIDPLNITLNNVRGLRIGTNCNWRRPTSDHVIFQYLKNHVLTSDLAVLVETKTVGQFYEENDPFIENLPALNNFQPFGKDFPSVAYTCTGPSHGIIVFVNNQTVEILKSEIIEVGRLIKITGQKRATKENFILFAAYLNAGNDLDSRVEYCSTVNKINSHLTPAVMAGNPVYIVGDFNADVYNPSRVGGVKEKALRELISDNNLIDLRLQNDTAEPTFFPSDVYKKSATLDYILHNKPVRYRSVTNSVNPCSDHTIIQISNSIKPPPLVTRSLTNSLKTQVLFNMLLQFFLTFMMIFVNRMALSLTTRTARSIWSGLV